MIPRTFAQQMSAPSFLTFVLAGFLPLASIGMVPIVGNADDSVQNAYQSRQIKIGHARQFRPRKSAVAQAAAGQVLTELPPAPLDGSLVKQVGFVDGCDSCGPVCGCGAEVVYSEPVCGCDAAIGCSCGAEVACGVEPTCGCPVGECSCGVEIVGCGVEVVSCGVEVGPGCGLENCLTCQASCGLETVCDGPICGAESIGDCGCDACCGTSAGNSLFPFIDIKWQRFDFFAGVQGFKGPMNFASVNVQDTSDRRGSGSFGFYQGFNEGRSLRNLLGGDLALQFGLRATQSNLSGTDFSEETRHQIFLTLGLFRRVDYGLQMGLAIDYLNEDWYYQADLAQLRGELSWNTGGAMTYGFEFMAGVDDDSSTASIVDDNGSVVASTVRFEATDQYRLFFRRRLPRNGQLKSFVGWTDNDDGILGFLTDTTITNKLLLNTGVTYLVPNEGDASGGNQQEGWNIGIGMTFRPAGAGNARYRYSRPLLNVADNGTFLIDRL